ncbi:T9SS type A sorting domain-containing protein [Flavobacterium aciduliphilum]|uniref:Putative delta-60 repeat protein/predicted secreted protein (Por secretion system target) n=1 Tax=Flavobacterium aciduliphilum TaxID=1101402 RepID=A0A328YSH8_9FLAO|nr:T9SS type A sorting domain-containing protein [Flavobacterium aciduliphilum]RAR75725.1 putative delta-60 repeat protein/predicted secreted protein (Por secretion system target) [Flavobacterium aciduliphilum]
MNKPINYFKFIFLLVFVTTSNAQIDGKSTQENWSSPQGVFDKVYNSDGTSIDIKNILAGKTYTVNSAPSTSVLLCTSGIFELYFETGCGMEITTNALHNQRRAILCQAFQDVSDFINTPLKNTGNTTKVKIWIRNQANAGLTSSEKARGVSFHALPFPSGTASGNKGGISDGEVWRTIHTGKDSYTNVVFPVMNTENPQGIYHGYLTFNFTTPSIWNYAYSKYNAGTGFPVGNYDFYTQSVHEIMHLLGVTSLLNENGGSFISFLPGTSGSMVSPYYSRFDKFLKAYPTTLVPAIANVVATGGQMYGYQIQISSPLTPGCLSSPPVAITLNTDYANCSTSLQYIGGTTLPLYTPKCFEKYFSFSHFEDSCFGTAGNDNYFIMSNKENGAIAKRSPSAEERLVLNDIGYSVKGTFGSSSNFTYRNYGVNDSEGIPVGGVNDAFNPAGTYVYQVNSGTNITLTGFLANDYIGSGTANLRFEFLEDLYDSNATFTATLGDSSTNVVFKSYVPGIHILRYVPYDNLSGKRGNITYIAVNVLNNCAVSNPCELVKNGDFEQYNLTPNAIPYIMSSCGWQNADYRGTADYFNTAIGNPQYSIPCNFMGNQPDRVAGNHAYVGGIFSTLWCENIKTELNTALLPNTAYQLKFDVSLAESRSQQSIKFQAFITDADLQLTATNGFIPSSSITADKVFITNTTFSNATTASADGWQTITLNFTTSSNTNLKYLYIGGLNNVQVQSETGQALVCPVSYGAYSGNAYYYIDNVSVLKTTSTTIDAINDDFSSSIPINGASGGVTTSVYANDLYNGTASSSASLPNVTFALVAPLSITGATINSSGLISIPAGTPAGTYTLTYSLSLVGNCTAKDTASVIILVTNNNTTPTLVAGIRANNAVNHIELQNTGRSIISGYFTTYNNISKPYVARLNTDLTLDQTFTFAGNQGAMDLAIQSDNKIIAATSSAGFGGTSLGITRLLPDGAVDPNFNTGGTGISRNISYTNEMAYACAIQTNGDILLGGDFYYYNGVQRLGIVRIKTNGSIDYTFNPTVLNTYYRSVVTGITIQPNGQIILLGFFSPPTAGATQKNIIRLNSDGNIDPTFNAGDTAGSLVYNVDLGVSLYSPIAKAVVQPDGMIIIAGAFNKYNSNNVKSLVRLTSTGGIDGTFNTATGVERAINELILEPTTNRLIIGGEFTLFGTTAVKKIIRLTTTGALDTTFSIGTGTTDNPVSGCTYCSNYVKALKQQPDGKIIVGGKFLTFNGLSATNITRIFGSAGVQAKSSLVEYHSEPEIDMNPNYSSTIIYPNPSNGIYNIDLSDVKELTTIAVFNILGEEVFKQLLTPQNQNQIDLSNLANGYYIARISNESSNSQHKLIKN